MTPRRLAFSTEELERMDSWLSSLIAATRVQTSHGETRPVPHTLLHNGAVNNHLPTLLELSRDRLNPDAVSAVPRPWCRFCSTWHIHGERVFSSWEHLLQTVRDGDPDARGVPQIRDGYWDWGHKWAHCHDQLTEAGEVAHSPLRAGGYVKCVVGVYRRRRIDAIKQAQPSLRPAATGRWAVNRRRSEFKQLLALGVAAGELEKMCTDVDNAGIRWRQD